MKLQQPENELCLQCITAGGGEGRGGESGGVREDASSTVLETLTQERSLSDVLWHLPPRRARSSGPRRLTALIRRRATQ